MTDEDQFERLPDLEGCGLWRRRTPRGSAYWINDNPDGWRVLFDEGYEDWGLLLALADRLGVSKPSDSTGAIARLRAEIATAPDSSAYTLPREMIDDVLALFPEGGDPT